MKWKHSSITRLYIAWRNMRRRCSDSKDASYHHYGGRGITVCREWLTNYDEFAAWALSNGYMDTLTLDRIDVNGNYEPDNCRWATVKEQHNNERRNVIVEFQGKRQTLAQWADELAIAYDTLWKRIFRSKMTLELALSPGSIRDIWEHGTRSGYYRGCKCPACKTAHNTRMREQRMKRNDIIGYTKLVADRLEEKK